MEELYKMKTSGYLCSQQPLDDNVKTVSFNFARKSAARTMIKFFVKSFDLIESKHLFVDKIRELIAEHNYKDVCIRNDFRLTIGISLSILNFQACHFADELQLYEEFTIFEFVFPLILQLKSSTAEEYVERAVHMQQPLIQLLDSLLGRTSSIQNICDKYIG